VDVAGVAAVPETAAMTGERTCFGRSELLFPEFRRFVVTPPDSGGARRCRQRGELARNWHDGRRLPCLDLFVGVASE
jgi:hypothetical protein